jgi:excisionase family DNA binding protein
MNTIIHTEILTPEELAERLKLPVSWIYEHCRERALNRLPGFKLGKYWRFRESDVREWLERQSR